MIAFISTLGKCGNGYVCTPPNISVVYFTIFYYIGYTRSVYCGNPGFLGNYEINVDVIR